MFGEYTPLITAVGIVILALLIGKIFLILTKRVIRTFTLYTETDLDDRLAKAMSLPIYLMIIWVGFFLALSVTGIHFTTPELALSIERTGYILTAIWLGIRIVNAIFGWVIEKDRRSGDTNELTVLLIARRAVALILYALAFLVGLDQAGVEITPLLASLGVGGLAVALALQDTLTNYFSGVYVASDKSIRVGDLIELDTGLKGTVYEIGWRRTTILDREQNLIIIPNKKISESILINYNYPEPSISMRIDFGVTYESDLDKVEKVATATAKKIQKKYKDVVADHDPTVKFYKMSESSIDMILAVQLTDYTAKMDLRNDLIKQLSKDFRKSKIDFSYPARNVYFQDALSIDKSK